MGDYKERFEELREAAEAATRMAQETARQGFDVLAEGARRASAEAERLDDEYGVSSTVKDLAREAADKAAERARAASDILREAGRVFETRTRKFYAEAEEQYSRHSARATKIFATGTGFVSLTDAAVDAAVKARDWARENPGKTAVVGISLVAGIRLGAAFTGFDAVLLGAHPHWLTHSALPVWALRKAGEKFDTHLREREKLIADGNVEQVERERIEFERNIVKYVGAPLLGAFSFAAGAAMWAQIFSPGQITGAPVSWLLGGNPLLDGVWLFANGVICFHEGYKFFMIALSDQKEAERIVREIKGLLPVDA
ncbi:MAG: hypothetical protein ACRD4L_08110 [Pyrinomonadaceae bacterium]